MKDGMHGVANAKGWFMENEENKNIMNESVGKQVHVQWYL